MCRQRRFARQEERTLKHDTGRPRGNASRRHAWTDPAADPDRSVSSGQQLLKQNERGASTYLSPRLLADSDQTVNPGKQCRLGLGGRSRLAENMTAGLVDPGASTCQACRVACSCQHDHGEVLSSGRQPVRAGPTVANPNSEGSDSECLHSPERRRT
jgi:hypothetical protein